MSLLVMAALAVGFTSCNNGDEPSVVNNGETKTVVLKLAGGAPASYAEGTAAKAEDVIELTSAYLYFVDKDGDIKKRVKLITTGTAGTDEILISGSTEFPVEGLSDVVTAAHVVGNPVEGVAALSTGNISAVKALSVGMATQMNLAKLNLYGAGNLVGTSTVGQYTCEVKLAPTVARLEVGKIQNLKTSFDVQNETDGYRAFDFRLKGVFVDDFYLASTVDGTLKAEDLKSFGSAAYISGYQAGVHDWYGTSSAALASTGDATDEENLYNVVPSGTNTVWAYHLPAAANNTNTPKIVFSLDTETFTVEDGELSQTPEWKAGFVTANFPPGATFEPGYVYSIQPVGFNAGIVLPYNDEGEDPDPEVPTEKFIDVKVTVTPAKWKVKTVTPVVS